MLQNMLIDVLVDLIVIRLYSMSCAVYKCRMFCF